MTDVLRTRALGALAAGALLALATAFGGVAAAACGLLAQPAFALGVSRWRRTRAAAPLSAQCRQDLPDLLAVWTGGALVLALLVSWPLAALHDSGSLQAVLALCVAVSIAVAALWRTWPLWQALERGGGTLRAHWQALSARGMDSWQGVGAALALWPLCAPVAAPAWPGLVGDGLRWPRATATPPRAALRHAGPQAL